MTIGDESTGEVHWRNADIGSHCQQFARAVPRRGRIVILSDDSTIDRHDSITVEQALLFPCDGKQLEIETIYRTHGIVNINPRSLLCRTGLKLIFHPDPYVAMFTIGSRLRATVFRDLVGNTR